jgi:hypothetical protein
MITMAKEILITTGKVPGSGSCSVGMSVNNNNIIFDP